jgi:GNAT superfamily N-acetyltransferase
MKIECHPLTPERWKDFETLFGPKGACAGCWCMWWRLKQSTWKENQGDGNRRAMQALIRKGTSPGILAYVGDTPVGWCAIAPREEYPRLAGSRILAPIDDRSVWSVTCFFIKRDYRRHGITARLLEAAVRHARASGARIVEGYPVIPKSENAPAVFAYTGILSAFEKAGFREVARRSAGRPIMRREMRPKATRPPASSRVATRPAPRASRPRS